MRRLVAPLIALTVLMSMLSGGSPAAQAVGGGASFYVSLGDSLSVGFQPGLGETRKGYVDDLWRTARAGIPRLEMRQFGCIGETSRSVISGGHPRCQYAAGSQLDAAVAFLQGHVGQVPFITIDVGGNDLFGHCLDDGGLLHRACVVDLLPRFGHRVTHIVGALRAAAGPGVPILAMTIHDPLLGFWGLIPRGRHLARVDQRAVATFNAGLVTAFEDAGAVVADVAATFRIDDFTDTIFVHGRGRLPVNVALACRWTWFCTQGSLGDFHPNAIGYRRIAHTFDRALQPLLP